MKKLYYLMAISCMFLSLPLTSCDDDDDDDVKPENLEETGHTTGSKNLTGALTVVVGSTTMTPFYQDLTVNDDYANGTLEIDIENFSFSFVGQSIPFGELNVKCNYTEGNDFEGSTTVTYGGDIDFTVEGTYDGTDLEFSSSFEVVGQTISFTFSTKQTIGEDDATDEGETDENGEDGDSETDEEGDVEVSDTREYVGTVSGSYSLMGLFNGDIEPISDIPATVGTTDAGETVVTLDGEIALDLSSVLSSLGSYNISDIVVNCGEVAEDGTFTGTVSFSLEGETMTSDLTGTILENSGLDIEATFSILEGMANVTLAYATE